jgi:hypothetical protein
MKEFIDGLEKLLVGESPNKLGADSGMLISSNFATGYRNYKPPKAPSQFVKLRILLWRQRDVGKPLKIRVADLASANPCVRPKTLR